MKEDLPEEPEESGLTEEQFRAEEEKRREEIEHDTNKPENGPEKLYFIFETEEQRNKALKLISEERKYNDLFRFLTDWRNDPLQQNNGLEMDFSRHPKNLKEKLEEFFKQKGLTLKEEYEVAEE